MRNRLHVACACWAFGLSLPAAALAEQVPRDRTWFATAYLGQWFSASEPSGNQSLGSQDAGFQDSYFASLLLTRVLLPELHTGWPVIGRLIDGGALELEAQAGRHFGLQDHAEVTLALLWRSPELPLPFTRGSMNLAIGEGFSYALSRPDYEGTAHGEDPRKFLNYLAVEAEFSHPSLPAVSVVPRVHHRSGIFGVIAPRGSGSDFIGIGLRFRLQ